MSRRLILIATLALVLFTGLALFRLRSPSGSDHRSALIGKPLPAVTLPPATPLRPGMTPATDGSGPRLINLFASWCVPCAVEAPLLGEMARSGVVIDGIAIRDTGPALEAFLSRHGNPYRRIGLDAQSGTQIALGSSGVPESFVVDGRGVIRYHLVGPVTPQNLADVRSALEQAR